jgi:hypothetical protein
MCEFSDIEDVVEVLKGENTSLIQAIKAGTNLDSPVPPFGILEGKKLLRFTSIS